MEDCLFYFDNDFLQKHGDVYAEHIWTEQEMKPTSCSHMILGYVAHGKGELFINGVKHEISEGDTVLINSGSEYCILSDAAGHLISMYVCVFNKKALPYSYESIGKPFKELHNFIYLKSGSIVVHDTPHMDIRSLMLKIIDEYSYLQEGWQILIKCTIASTLITLFRLYTKYNHNKKVPQHQNKIVGYMLNYANRNFYKKCSLNEIAQNIHFSPQHICKVFKDSMGMTFIEYCNDLRIKKIKYELENTDRPFHLLYGDYEFSPRYLNKLFKEYTGYNITDYKRKFNYKSNNPLYPK